MPPVPGETEVTVPVKVIVIFYKPLPSPRDPMPIGTVRDKLSQPFVWPDGRTAQMRFGANKPMNGSELDTVNKASGAETAPQESKIGLVPGVIMLTLKERRSEI